MPLKPIQAALAAFALLGAALPAAAAVTTFDHGTSGWRGAQGSGGGGTFIDTDLGNDAPALHTVFTDFGITFSNQRRAFTGDFTASPSLQIGIDVNTLSLTYGGQQVTRDLIVEFRDHDNAPDGMPYTSVWARIGTLDASTPGWTTFSITIADTSATTLPSGWGGYGAENPVTFEPELPAGRTFANVLAGVDELAFGTLVPGFFYGFTDFNVAVDNITLSPVPEPAAVWLLIGGFGALALARRRAGSRS